MSGVEGKAGENKAVVNAAVTGLVGRQRRHALHTTPTKHKAGADTGEGSPGLGEEDTTTRRCTSSPCVPSDRRGRWGQRRWGFHRGQNGSWTVLPWQWIETLGRWTRHTHPAAPHALSDQEKDGRRQERYRLTARRSGRRVRGLLVGQKEDGEARRSSAHHRGTDERPARRHATPLRLLQRPRRAKHQGLWKGRRAGNAETARPTVASRACFRRTPANWGRCWAKRTCGPDLAIESSIAVKLHSPTSLKDTTITNHAGHWTTNWPTRLLPLWPLHTVDPRGVAPFRVP